VGVGGHAWMSIKEYVGLNCPSLKEDTPDRAAVCASFMRIFDCFLFVKI